MSLNSWKVFHGHFYLVKLKKPFFVIVTSFVTKKSKQKTLRKHTIYPLAFQTVKRFESKQKLRQYLFIFNSNTRNTDVTLYTSQITKVRGCVICICCLSFSSLYIESIVSIEDVNLFEFVLRNSTSVCVFSIKWAKTTRITVLAVVPFYRYRMLELLSILNHLFVWMIMCHLIFIMCAMQFVFLCVGV